LDRETVTDLFEDAGDLKVLNGHGVTGDRRNGPILGAVPVRPC
jgi:hypothetical protein